MRDQPFTCDPRNPRDPRLVTWAKPRHAEAIVAFWDESEMPLPPPPPNPPAIERLATKTQEEIRVPANQPDTPRHRLTPADDHQPKTPEPPRRRPLVPRGFTSIYAPVAVVIFIYVIVIGVRSWLWPKAQERSKKFGSKPRQRKFY